MAKKLHNLITKAAPRMILTSDLAGVSSVEKTCFNAPWQVSDFAKCLDRKHCNGLVIEANGVVLGFLIYEVLRRSVHLINLGVRHDARRHGLGTKLLQKLITFMQESEVSRVYAEMRESNLIAQLFLKKVGFQATSVVRDYFEDTKEDMYQMEYNFK